MKKRKNVLEFYFFNKANLRYRKQLSKYIYTLKILNTGMTISPVLSETEATTYLSC